MGKSTAKTTDANRKAREDDYRAKAKARDEYDSQRRACFEHVMFYIHERMNEAIDESDRETARTAYKTSHKVSDALMDLFPEWIDLSGASEPWISRFEKLTGYKYGNKPR